MNLKCHTSLLLLSVLNFDTNYSPYCRWVMFLSFAFFLLLSCRDKTGYVVHSISHNLIGISDSANPADSETDSQPHVVKRNGLIFFPDIRDLPNKTECYMSCHSCTHGRSMCQGYGCFMKILVIIQPYSETQEYGCWEHEVMPPRQCTGRMRRTPTPGHLLSFTCCNDTDYCNSNLTSRHLQDIVRLRLSSSASVSQLNSVSLLSTTPNSSLISTTLNSSLLISQILNRSSPTTENGSISKGIRLSFHVQIEQCSLICILYSTVVGLYAIYKTPIEGPIYCMYIVSIVPYRIIYWSNNVIFI